MLSPAGETGSAGHTRQEAADCRASAFLGRSRRLIAALWAAALQLSQDRSRELVQHANKTAGASPTAHHWLPGRLPPTATPALVFRKVPTLSEADVCLREHAGGVERM